MTVIVAIHQPNYLPWLGYFHKIALADVFVFLDDAQFSKNGYINRVRIMGPAGPRWLTVPVSVHLGDAINEVFPARADWPARHLDSLRGFYRRAPACAEVCARLEGILAAAPQADLAAINRHLVEGLAREMGLSCRFLAASEFETRGRAADRLVELVAAVDAKGTYLSGRGARKYQDPAKFAAAGLGFRYAAFEHPVYDQDRLPFEPGLSVVDALMHLGWAETASLLRRGATAAGRGP